MSTATMTSKGQITIPKYVRERLGLEPATEWCSSSIPTRTSR